MNSRTFFIEKPNSSICQPLQEKIDNLTKPKGALGLLEEVALQVGCIQQTLEPQLSNPHHIVFAGDHGIAHEGVSASPQEVTFQMVANFLDGGAGVNFLARQHNINLIVVDAGVNFDFDPQLPILHCKVRKGTRNYLYEAAMSNDELEACFERGAKIVDACHEKGCNIISFGEMGITNTSSSALWMSFLANKELSLCVGAGCDNTGSITAHKLRVLQQAKDNYKGDSSPRDIIRYFGGYEMVMTVGAMLRAAELKMTIVIDGFIMTSCILAASALYPNAIHYAIFGHQSNEAGHQLLLNHLKVKPLLNLNLRLGEGTGALCAYPLIDSAVRMVNEMNSFERIHVTKYFN